MKLKETLLAHCKDFVNQRLQTVEAIISDHQKALQSETKSSAGDKHETGRAMLQLEMEKASQQLVGISTMNNTLSKIDTSKTSAFAHLGSIIITDNTNYFLAISAGKLSVSYTNYFAVSIASPVGKVLLGKQKGDVFIFNNKKSQIQEIL